MSEDPTSPRHYTCNHPEPIDVIQGWGLNFCLGNVVKYISRAGLKRNELEIEDLRKAAWYLNREIERLETALARLRAIDSGRTE